jgi:hypothetical protein
MIRILRRIFRRRAVLFLTHSPWGFHLGETHLHNGRLFIITKVRRVGPTALFGGGSVPCWEVLGVSK